jgi:hypothetical protein
MLGFNPVGAAAAAVVDPDLVQVDAALSSGGYETLHALVDDWMVVSVGDPEWVFQWRLQAEVEVGLPLPGGVRLLTRIILAVIKKWLSLLRGVRFCLRGAYWLS